MNIVVSSASRTGVPAAPVFALAGGPGDASTTMLSSVVRSWRSVVDARDVVLVDQRGTGASNGLQCERTIDHDPAAAFGHVFDPAVVSSCRTARSAHADLAAYTTAAAVEDLDEVRAALGHDRIMLWGGSYGSRLAIAYLRRYPERVSFAVLDSIAPPEVSMPTRYAATLQRAVDLTLAECANLAECRRTHPTLRRDLDRIVERLRRSPVSTFVRLPDGTLMPVTMSLGDVAYAIRGILYAADGHTRLPAIVHAAAARDDFHILAQRYWERAVRLSGALSLGLHLSVLCSEDVPDQSDAAADGETTGTIMGRYLLDEYRRACREWGVARTPAAGGSSSAPIAPIAVPALLLSGEFDPVTPPEYGEATRAWLPEARHFVVAGASHGVSFGCAREAVAHALARGTLNGLPPVCGQAALPR